MLVPASPAGRAGAPKALRAGSLVQAAVLGRDGTGRWIVSVNGKRFTVKGPVDLTGRRVVSIRVGSHPPVAGKPLLQAFVRSGLPVPDAGRLERMQHFSDDAARLRTRLAVLSEDKSTSFGSGQLDQLCALFGRRPHDQGGGDRQRGRRDTRQAVLSSISGQDGPDGHPVQLFNHHAGSRGTWLIIPFTFRDGETELDCVLTGRVPPGENAIREAALNVRGRQGVWGFVFSTRAGPLRMYGDRPTGDESVHIENLRVKLRKLGIILDDTYYKKVDFDGFPDCGAGQEYEPVDVTV